MAGCCNICSCFKIFIRKTCFFLDIIQGIFDPRWSIVGFLAENSIVDWNTSLSKAFGKSWKLNFWCLDPDPLAIISGQTLEQKHEPTQQKRGKYEENEIFGIFKGQNEILVDKQIGLLHEASGIILYQFALLVVGYLWALRDDWLFTEWCLFIDKWLLDNIIRISVHSDSKVSIII